MGGSLQAGRVRRIAGVMGPLAVLAATLILLFLTEPIAVRFWFAATVTAGLVFLLTALSLSLIHI